MKIKNWEKELYDLLVFTEDEGLDPDRFYSLFSKTLNEQRRKFIKIISEEIKKYKCGKHKRLLKIIKEL